MKKSKGAWVCSWCGSGSVARINDCEPFWSIDRQKWLVPNPTIKKTEAECLDCSEEAEYINLTAAPYSDRVGQKRVLLMPTGEDEFEEAIERFDNGSSRYYDGGIIFVNNTKYYIQKSEKKEEPGPSIFAGEMVFLKKVNAWQWEVVDE